MRNAKLIALLMVATPALANVAGDCQPDYAECQGEKGYVTNPADWNYKAQSWRLVQLLNGYAVYAHEGHARFRVAVNLKTLPDQVRGRVAPGWSLERSLMSPGQTGLLCVMYDQTVHLTRQDGFPVDVRAFWAGECPKGLGR